MKHNKVRCNGKKDSYVTSFLLNLKNMQNRLSIKQKESKKTPTISTASFTTYPRQQVVNTCSWASLSSLLPFVSWPLPPLLRDWF